MVEEPRSALVVLNGISIITTIIIPRLTIIITTTITITNTSPMTKAYPHRRQRFSTADRRPYPKQVPANLSIITTIFRGIPTIITTTTITHPARLCLWHLQYQSRFTIYNLSWKKPLSDLENILGHNCTRLRPNCQNPTHRWTINLATPRNPSDCRALTSILSTVPSRSECRDTI